MSGTAVASETFTKRNRGNYFLSLEAPFAKCTAFLEKGNGADVLRQ